MGCFEFSKEYLPQPGPQMISQFFFLLLNEAIISDHKKLGNKYNTCIPCMVGKAGFREEMPE